MELVKPHIQRLPIVAFPKYNSLRGPVSVSIPLFHSRYDSNTLKDFDERRFREVHLRGAIWTAIGLIYNTDLGKHGVPIYFHLEKKIVDLAMSEFEKYKVPRSMVRSVEVPEVDLELPHPQYGKKLMGLADSEKAGDTWLIIDTDAFFCTTGSPVFLYAYLSELKVPAPLTVFVDSDRDYKNWVHGLCYAVGRNFEDDPVKYYSQELMCVKKAGLDFSPPNPKEDMTRFGVSTHILAVPNAHSLRDFLVKRYMNCYHDEFLLGLWHQKNRDMVSLRDELGIRHYKRESQFIERDVGEDKNGYLAHIMPDDLKKQKHVDKYFAGFNEGLTSRMSSSFEVSEPVKAKQVNKTFRTRLRIFVVGIAYGGSNKKMLSSPFVQRTVRFPEMMKALGHEVYHLGHERASVDCTEHITVMYDDVLERVYGHADMQLPPKGAAADDLAFQYFHINVEREIRKRVQKGDIIVSFCGWGDQPLFDRLRDLPCFLVEGSIGYPDSFNDYKVYQSPSKMHLERGRAAAVVRMRAEYPESEPAKKYRTWEKLTESEPDAKSVCIPNFYDPSEFERTDKKSDYMLFIGRIEKCKGLNMALKLAEYTGDRLIVAGPGDLSAAEVPIPKSVEFVGVADLDKRKELYRDARVAVLMSRFLEPGHSTHIEAGFGECPIIVPNTGITMDFVRQGYNGFRCHPDDFSDVVNAYENIDLIEPANCFDYAMNFSMDRIALIYHEWFHKIIRNAECGEWDVLPPEYRTDLSWLAFPEFPYPAEAVARRREQIQSQIGREMAMG